MPTSSEGPPWRYLDSIPLPLEVLLEILLRRLVLIFRFLGIRGPFSFCIDMKQQSTSYLKTKECSGGVGEEAYCSGGVSAGSEDKEEQKGEVVGKSYQKPLPVAGRHLK